MYVIINKVVNMNTFCQVFYKIFYKIYYLYTLPTFSYRWIARKEPYLSILKPDITNKTEN